LTTPQTILNPRHHEFTPGCFPFLFLVCAFIVQNFCLVFFHIFCRPVAGEKWPQPEISLGAWKRLGNQKSKNRPNLDIGNLMSIQDKTENNISLDRTFRELSNALMITKIQWTVAKIYASYSQWQTGWLK